MTLLLLFPSLPVTPPVVPETETGVDNPEYTVADVISDVNGRLRNPGVGAEIITPWVSYAYNRLYNKLLNVNQQVKEQLFGAYTTIDLEEDVAEYVITEHAPRYSSLVKYEIHYGTNQITSGKSIYSIAKSPNNVITGGSGTPRLYRYGNNFAFYPIPGEGTAHLWYIKRGKQLTQSTDVLYDIPYRYLYPIMDYVEGRVIARINEDYGVLGTLEREFERKMEEVAMMADGEISEWDVESIDDGSPDMRSPFNSI